MNTTQSDTSNGRTVSLTWHNFSLGTKLTLAFLAVTLIPLAALAYMNDRISRQALTQEANEKLGAAAQQTAAILDEFMTENTNAVRTEAQFPAVVDYVLLPEDQRAGSPEEARLSRYLAGASRQDPVYLNSIAVLDAHGKTLMDTNASVNGLLRSDRYYFQEVLKTNRAYASTLEYDTVTKQPSLYFAAPIHNATGEIIGVLRRRFDGAVLMEYVSAEKGLAGVGSFAVLLDQNLIRLAHAANSTLVHKLVVPLDEGVILKLQSNRFLPPGTLEDISTNRQDFADGLKNADTQPYFVAELTNDGQLEQVAVARMQTQNWQVAFAVPQDEFLGSINRQGRNNVLLALGIAILVAAFGFFVSGTLSGPIVRLTHTAEAIAGGNIQIQAEVETGDEIGTLAGTFNRMTQQLRDFINTLETRVAERTRNLELAAEVGRTVSQVRALDVMLTDAAELIRKQFNLYYVQVYLVNPSQTYLHLQAGTGHVGKQLLERQHRLPLNSDSINGRAALDKTSVVISNTTASATFKPNPLLPDTRSEMAVPLLIGDHVVGVLDMQSEQADALSMDVLPAFEALAGQLAIAIQNANFLAETEQARAEVEAQAQRLTRSNWDEYLDAVHKPEESGFVFERNQVIPLATEEVTTSENARVVPISITGEALGSLVVELEGQSPIARTDELISTVARQVSQQIENIRLLDSAERYRFEAELASRRITREGWKEYAAEVGDLSYVYDLKEVRPQNNQDQEIQSAGYSLPLKVREETIGKLVVQGIAAEDAEAVSLANAVAERLGAHIENLRLYDQTGAALAQSERLFAASRRMTQAVGLQELVAATVMSMGISKVNRALLTTFDYDANGEIRQLDVVANWWSGEGHEITPIGTRYSLDVIRLMPMFVSPVPVFFSDTLNDPRIDATTMQLVKRLNLRAVAVLPLHLGGRQIGALILEAEQPHNFTQDEIRLFSALAPQIATIMQNQRQFEQAQQQAERESKLNAISQKIQSATTVEAVLQIAARELGHTLGAPLTIAQLGLKEHLNGNGQSKN